MKSLFRFFLLLNTLSVDVAAGAAISAVFFAHLLNVKILPQGFIALALTVWIIYTTDHLVDARRVPREAASRRHRFHQKHFWVLVFFTVIVLIIDLVLAFYIRRTMLYAALLLAVFVGLYIFLSRRVPFVKEWMAALLYTGGVLLPGLSLNGWMLNTRQGVLMILFALIVLINLLEFAWLSFEEDLSDSQPSLFTQWGIEGGRRLIMMLFISLGLILVLTPDTFFSREGFTLSVMAFVLLLIFIFPVYFKVNDRFRVIGDSVFLFPLFTLIPFSSL